MGKEVDTSALGFASHALPCSIRFLLSWLVLSLARPDCFQSSILVTILLWGPVVVIFLAARVPARSAAAWILPPLLLLFIAALCRNARTEQSPDNFEGVLGRIRPLNVLGLILISVSAIVVYAGFQTLDLLVSTNVVLHVITMPLGFWFFFRSLWVIFRPRNA